MNATQLAQRLGVSKARISQYVSSGKLDGCFSGDGRSRTFDEQKVAVALGKALHPGQMMGNGSQTRAVIRDLQARAAAPVADAASAMAMPARSQPEVRSRDGVLPSNDNDRYELARIQKAEEEARRLRRQNAQEEGLYVLASEVERNVARMLAQEVSEFETVLRDAARAVADAFGVDFRSVRKVLVDTWRDHRRGRAVVLAEGAEAAGMTEAERDEDI